MNISTRHPISDPSRVPIAQANVKTEATDPKGSQTPISALSTAEEAKAQTIYLKNVIIALPALVLRAQANLDPKPMVAAV